MPSGVSVTLYDAACLILQEEGEGERHFSPLPDVRNDSNPERDYENH